jgi:hypothetical protein
MQPDCGCSHRELSACHAGKGPIAGRVTVLDCIECRRDNAGRPST